MADAALELLKKNLDYAGKPVDLAKIIPSQLWQKNMPKIYLHHGVFNPTLTYTTPFIIKTLQKYFQENPLDRHMHFCDIMTGSGAIAYALWLLGARHIVTADISQEATVIALNLLTQVDPAEKYIQVYQSDLFHHPEMTHHRFDFIIANPPLLPTSPRRHIQRLKKIYPNVANSTIAQLTGAIFDEKYRLLKKLLIESRLHLKKRGRLIVTTSNWSSLHGHGRYPKVEDILQKYAQKVHPIGKMKRLHGETYTVYELRFASSD